MAAITTSLSGAAYGQIDGTALLLQQTPEDAGVITPGLGVHRFEPDTEITLTAAPKPGYQFVYWIGDVSNSGTSSTTVYLDKPKIIIAVFERMEFQFEPMLARSAGMSRGDRLFPTATDFVTGELPGEGAKRPSKYRRAVITEEEPDFPVPQDSEGNDLPVPEPIPEPATGILLGIASLFALAKGRMSKKRPTTEKTCY
jgi:hypothetical protein